MFTNREIATAIWLTLFAARILTKSDLRTSLAGVVRSFLAAKVLASFVALALYTAVVIVAHYAAGFWQSARQITSNEDVDRLLRSTNSVSG